jgi:glycosyltransferase involved in cell wall biosynthesis
MELQPLVTCICPTADRQEFIPLAIKSFLAQSYTNSELLIVDDGEKDTVVPNNPRIRYIRLPYREQYSHFSQAERIAHNAEKRNFCCQEAHGEIIVQFDDDDWSHPDRVAHQVQRLQQTGKKVTGYHSLSYYDVKSHQSFKLISAGDGIMTGTSLCYYRSYAIEHPFDCKEDVNFSRRAQVLHAADCVDGADMIVVRRHSNLCSVWDGLPWWGTWGTLSLKELPREFLEDAGIKLPAVSVVMTTFNRPVQLRNTLESLGRQRYTDYEIIVIDDGDDEETPAICKSFNVKYTRVNRPKSVNYRNPARPTNIGIRQASGEIVILQNAECRHVDSETIQKLVSRVTDSNAVFARVTSLTQEGRPNSGYPIYCGKENPRPLFFCGAMKRIIFEKLRGFDEDYTTVCYEDSDFADRLEKEGIKFEFSEIEVHHQWHPYLGVFDVMPAFYLYQEKSTKMKAGLIGTVRNLDRDWGALQNNPTPKVVSKPVIKPTPPIKRALVNEQCTVDWWDTPAGKKMRKQR